MKWVTKIGVSLFSLKLLNLTAHLWKPIEFSLPSLVPVNSRCGGGWWCIWGWHGGLRAKVPLSSTFLVPSGTPPSRTAVTPRLPCVLTVSILADDTACLEIHVTLMKNIIDVICVINGYVEKISIPCHKAHDPWISQRKLRVEINVEMYPLRLEQPGSFFLVLIIA